LFHNSNLFGSCIIHILYTECAKIKKNNSGAKGLRMQRRSWKGFHKVASLYSLEEVFSCTRGLFWRKCSLSDCTVLYFSEIKWFREHSEATTYKSGSLEDLCAEIISRDGNGNSVGSFITTVQTHGWGGLQKLSCDFAIRWAWLKCMARYAARNSILTVVLQLLVVQ